MCAAARAQTYRHATRLAALLIALAATGACRSEGADADAALPLDDAEVPRDSDPATDSGSAREDADLPSCEEMSNDCVSEFGSLFTQSNGRADGTLVALLEPTDTQCVAYNNDHVVLEIEILGQVQRLVVAIDGVAVHTTTGSLIGPAFAEGWHTGMNLDYPSDLGVHSADFTPVTMTDAVTFLCAATRVGAPISVFAYCDGTYPSSAHQIHRNDIYPDGAIVIDPTAETSTYLLFRYADQVF